MTREEAIRIFQSWIDWDSELQYADREENIEIYKRAIKALEQEPCEDAINRDELLKAVDTWDKFGYTETGCFVREPKNDCVKYIHYDDVIKCIKGMPSVKLPEPKTGHWLRMSDLSEEEDDR